MSANINYQPEDCLRCNATGTDRFPDARGEFTQCTGCRGQGSVLVAQPARKCAACKGTGERRDSAGIHVCMPCYGTTWAHRYVPPRG